MHDEVLSLLRRLVKVRLYLKRSILHIVVVLLGATAHWVSCLRHLFRLMLSLSGVLWEVLGDDLS